MKVCVPITSRAAWGRLEPVVRALDSECKVQIVLASSATLERYGNVGEEIAKDWSIAFTCRSGAAGDTPGAMAVETGLLMTELVGAFDLLRPDFVLAHADRYETLAVAAAAAYMNIPLGHTQGGERTGSIDDKVRDAVSMLADYHYPCTTKAAERLLAMDCENVTVTGCSSIDGIANLPELADTYINTYGHGAHIDFDEPFMLACLHPDTTDEWGSIKTLEATVDALQDYQTIWLQPNIDAYGQHMTKKLNQECGERARVVKHLPVKAFYSLMNHCSCMVGNSSAAIREGSYMGVPAVVVGSRQAHREVGRNVIVLEYSETLEGDIRQAIEGQICHSGYPREYLYGDGHAAEHIATAILGSV